MTVNDWFTNWWREHVPPCECCKFCGQHTDDCHVMVTRNLFIGGLYEFLDAYTAGKIDRPQPGLGRDTAGKLVP